MRKTTAALPGHILPISSSSLWMSHLHLCKCQDNQKPLCENRNLCFLQPQHAHLPAEEPTGAFAADTAIPTSFKPEEIATAA